MIPYEVKYKKINSLFWKKLKKVKGDGFIEYPTQADVKVLNIRWFILEDETRIEIPCNKYIFKFSKERFFSIKDRMEAESGLDIKLNKR